MIGSFNGHIGVGDLKDISKGVSSSRRALEEDKKPQVLR
jgi:hypothetical protein